MAKYLPQSSHGEVLTWILRAKEKAILITTALHGVSYFLKWAMLLMLFGVVTTAEKKTSN